MKRTFLKQIILLLLAPVLQDCSFPKQTSENETMDADTLSFLEDSIIAVEIDIDTCDNIIELESPDVKSINNENEEDSIEENIECEPSTPPSPYYSHDLQTYKLHGRVKHVSSSPSSLSSSYQDLYFTKKGLLDLKVYNSHKEFEEDDDITITRNKKGFIIKIKWSWIDSNDYKYDHNNQVTSIIARSTSTAIEKYIKFDKYGNPLEANLYGEDGEDSKILGHKLYKYLKWDNCGNWIERKVFFEDKDTYYDDKERKDIYIQTRNIEYY